MKLISDEKIDKFQKDNSDFLPKLSECVAAKLALDFAQKELKDLAIEFAKYCALNRLKWIAIPSLEDQEKLNYEQFSTQQLFKKFLYQRNKTK